MNEFELKQLHSLLLVIACEIDRICRVNDIKYSLWAGTLIGAVRHRGFIPWDDDFDIAMPRDDYNRFLQIAQKELKEEFGIISINNKKKYGYGFAKITLKGTNIEQIGNKNGKNLEIWVDIFPYDRVPDSKIKRFIQNKKNYFLMKLLEEKYDGLYGRASTIKKLSFGLLHLLNYIIDEEKAKKSLDKNMMKYENENTSYITCISSPYGYIKEMLLSNYFEKLEEYEFEGCKFLGFANYNDYLSQIYGDYMVLPPEEKRHIHNLVIHDFGPYIKKDE